MTHPENGKPLWTESRVESLLEEFFRREMPPALREASPAPPRRRPLSAGQASAARTQTAKRRANSLAGFAMVGFSSLLMLMLAVLSWNGSNPDSQPPMHSPASDAAADGHPSESLMLPDPLKPTTDGPIEMRPRIQNVTTEDPPSNETPAFPELDIEVYPPDREATDEEPESSPREKPEHKPLPEETRELPESGPADAIDPDEAQIESVLPELAIG